MKRIDILVRPPPSHPTALPRTAPAMVSMHYLVRCRMQLAAHRLRSSQAALAQIADGVGYEPKAAFSRAFKKSFGAAPATCRRPQHERRRALTPAVAD